MTRRFYPVSARLAGHWVRCTLLTLRFAARLPDHGARVSVCNVRSKTTPFAGSTCIATSTRSIAIHITRAAQAAPGMCNE